MGIFKEGAKLIEQGEIKIEHQTQTRRRVSVGKESVTFRKLPGRTEVDCTCANGTRFCKSPAICKHKCAAVTYCTMRKVKW